MASQITAPSIVTTGTTPGFIDLLPLLQDSAVTLCGNVICMSATGLVRAWDVIRTGKWLAAGSPVLVGTAPAAIIESDASFAPSIALSVTAAGLIRIQCTGIAGATIRWTAQVTATEVVRP